MATLKFEGFLGSIPVLDATGLPEQNSRLNRDCWFVDGKLQPIKEAATDSTVPEGTETIYRYRPCPKDADQAYWITRSESYNVAPSPIPNDKYGRLYFTRKQYATGDAVELPHFYDVKGLLGRTNNTDLCTDTGTGPFPVSGATKYTLGVPSPATTTAELTSGYRAIGTSTNGTDWSGVSDFTGTGYAFTQIQNINGQWFAAGYNGVIATSSDGTTWIVASTPPEAADYTVQCFAYNAGLYIAGCNNGKLLTSTDGSSWALGPANTGVTIPGNIRALIYWDDRFWLGTTTGNIRRTVSGKLPTEEGAWEAASAVEPLFITGTGAVYAVTDVAAWNNRIYFTGTGGRLVCRNDAGTAWVDVGDGGTTGTYRSINVKHDNTAVIAVTDTAFIVAYSSSPATFTRFPIANDDNLRTIFQGAELRGASFGGLDQTVLVGTKGRIAYTDGSAWVAATPGKDFGETPILSVDHDGTRFVAVGGTRTAANVTTAPRYYAVTFVDGFGAESAPALAGKVTASSGDGFKISWGLLDNFKNNYWTVNKNGAKFYIYRTASSGSSTEFLRVDQVAYVEGTTDYSYTDSKTDDVLGEVMLSTDWVMPPEGLRGLVTLPGGVLAGFVDNTLWFSEPGQPHAWPVKYQRTVSAPIVGLSTFANSVLVTTIDRSYVASGIDPFNMALTELETDQSCISAESVVDMGGYSIYATPRGLVKVSSMTPEWITKQLFTPDQWAELNPSTLRATVWEGRYLAFFDAPEAGLSYAATGVNSFSIVPGADVDGVAWYSQAGTKAFTDTFDDKTYFIEGTALKIWNAGLTRKTCYWVSKLLQTPESLNFGWLQVQTANEGKTATVRYYSEEGYTLAAEVTFEDTDYLTRKTAISGKTYNPDGTEKSTFSGSVYDSTTRLPAGRRTRFHVVEIETDTKVRQVLFTQSAEELRSQ